MTDQKIRTALIVVDAIEPALLPDPDDEQRYRHPSFRRLAGLLAELQRQAGDGPFAAAQGDLSQAIGIDVRTVRNYLNVLRWCCFLTRLERPGRLDLTEYLVPSARPGAVTVVHKRPCDVAAAGVCCHGPQTSAADTRERNGAIVAAVAGGDTKAEVARRYGISPSRVARIVLMVGGGRRGTVAGV